MYDRPAPLSAEKSCAIGFREFFFKWNVQFQGPGSKLIGLPEVLCQLIRLFFNLISVIPESLDNTTHDLSP
jgi:hypothetical protein